MPANFLGKGIAVNAHLVGGPAQIAAAVSQAAEDEELFKLGRSFRPEDALFDQFINCLFEPFLQCRFD